MSLIVVRREVYEGRIRLLVLDRAGAERFTSAERYAMVSIAGPGQLPPPFASDENRCGVLFLQFDDVRPDERAPGTPMQAWQAWRASSEYFEPSRDGDKLVVGDDEVLDYVLDEVRSALKVEGMA